MVMPQMVLYERWFYDERKKEIDDAAEAWGYERLVEWPGFIGFNYVFFARALS